MNYSEYLKKVSSASNASSTTSTATTSTGPPPMSKSAYESLAPLNVPAKPLVYQSTSQASAVDTKARDPRLMTKSQKNQLRQREQQLEQQQSSSMASLSDSSQLSAEVSSQLAESMLLEGDTMLNFLKEQLNEMQQSAVSVSKEEARKRSPPIEEKPAATTTTTTDKRLRVDESKTALVKSEPGIGKENVAPTTVQARAARDKSPNEAGASTDDDNRVNVQINLRKSGTVVASQPKQPPPYKKPVAQTNFNKPPHFNNNNNKQGTGFISNKARKRALRQIDLNRTRAPCAKPVFEYTNNFGGPGIIGPAPSNSTSAVNFQSFNSAPHPMSLDQMGLFGPADFNWNNWNNNNCAPYDENYGYHRDLGGFYGAQVPFGGNDWRFGPTTAGDYWREDQDSPYSGRPYAPLNSSTPLGPAGKHRENSSRKPSPSRRFRSSVAAFKSPAKRSRTRRRRERYDRWSRSRFSRSRSGSRTQRRSKSRRRSRSRSRRRSPVSRSRSRTPPRRRRHRSPSVVRRRSSRSRSGGGAGPRRSQGRACSSSSLSSNDLAYELKTKAAKSRRRSKSRKRSRSRGRRSPSSRSHRRHSRSRSRGSHKKVSHRSRSRSRSSSSSAKSRSVSLRSSETPKPETSTPPSPTSKSSPSS